METIGNLACLWGPFTGCGSIISPTIPTDKLDFWMRFHPDFCCFCLPVGQEVNDLVALHVDENAAKPPATTESEVIYSKL